MLENLVMLHLNEDSNDYIFERDSSPAHYKMCKGISIETCHKGG